MHAYILVALVGWQNVLHDVAAAVGIIGHLLEHISRRAVVATQASLKQPRQRLQVRLLCWHWRQWHKCFAAEAAVEKRVLGAAGLVACVDGGG